MSLLLFRVLGRVFVSVFGRVAGARLGSQRIGQGCAAASPPRGLGLVGAGGPCGQVNDLHRLGDPAIGVGQGGKGLEKRRQMSASERVRAATAQDVGRGHAPEVGDQAQRIAVAHLDMVHIGDGQSETRPRQQVAGRAYVDLRMDTRDGAPRHGLVGGHQRGAQPGQRSRAEKGGNEQAVGFQRAPGEGQGAGQIIHRVEHARRCDQVEAPVGEGQAILVALDAARRLREAEAGVGRDRLYSPRPQARRQRSIGRTQIERLGEGSRHRIETVQNILDHPVAQEGVIGEARRRAMPADASHAPVENLGIGGRLAHARACAFTSALEQGGMGRIGAMVGTAAYVASRAIAFALPPRCPGCGAVTPDDHRFCLDCWQSLDFLGDDGCARCGVILSNAPAGTICGGCLADPPAIDGARAAVAYGPVARHVVMRLKYGGRPGHAETIGRLMARLVEPGDTLLVPVPLHRWRQFERRYNQSTEIARALARLTGLRVDTGLVSRTRKTRQQVGLSADARQRNVAGAFTAHPDALRRLKGRGVVLVDDVITTGSTVKAITRALKRAGVIKIDVISFARVVTGADVPI